MNSAVMAFFIFKAFCNLVGLWPSVKRGDRDAFRFYANFSKLHQRGQLFSFKTPWGIQPILKKITVLPQALCCTCQLCGNIPLCPGHFKWP